MTPRELSERTGLTPFETRRRIQGRDPWHRGGKPTVAWPSKSYHQLCHRGNDKDSRAHATILKAPARNEETPGSEPGASRVSDLAIGTGRLSERFLGATTHERL
jgi:hypothetical protein